MLSNLWGRMVAKGAFEKTIKVRIGLKIGPVSMRDLNIYTTPNSTAICASFHRFITHGTE